MGQWNHIDCSQPSPDNPELHIKWLQKQHRLFNGVQTIEDELEEMEIYDDEDIWDDEWWDDQYVEDDDD